ncbi:hypothetical protein HOU00_gp229 [Caulobacter phage CcrPW]|uniref:Uncharacterized protein n=1 Tax=Caulobacter phage CcrPW TaxID=2283271 RepID=A0A385EAZ3_9CAUD|nr:hypothetical protein HOU00_gp229 [Caulobacter phage CcrPW]AXQ68896.1 hypothetical protein CcrPW_gp357 [Caulobacter phage CcrPW]
MSVFLENGKATRNSILIHAAKVALGWYPNPATFDQVIEVAVEQQERSVGFDEVYAAERAARAAFRKHYSYLDLSTPVEPAKMAHRLLFIAMQVPA